MQLFEMQGLLAGKCLPGDIKVNESLAEYFLRQFNQRDELARQVSALQLSHDNIINSLGIKGDGPWSKLVIEYVMGLVAERDALAAENAAMDKFVDECLKVAWEGGSLDGGEIQDIGLKNGLLREETYCADQHENLVEDPSNFEDGDAIYFRTEITGTGAAISEIKALGVDELAEAWEAIKPEDGVSMSESTALKYKHRAMDVRDFAANLRAGRKG